jgi:hypothetical protein
MTYVPKYSRAKMPEPKSAHGFVWRLRKLTEDISSATDHRTRVISRINRSFWLTRAEARFETVGMLEICCKAGLSTEPTVLDAHRRIAAGYSSMIDVAHRLPNDEDAISIVVEARDALQRSRTYHLIAPHLSINRLLQIVRYSKAAFAFDELRRQLKHF